ncbi:E3 ubiquitin protein ligase [bacterium]|nr:E3 ubiquitin protein ligase [bacterium]NDD83495.1 E3 ubiquitin protein ligase [bacterium]NDG31533.1 E3 ubiquitin protein ligase [bacterium]
MSDFIDQLLNHFMDTMNEMPLTSNARNDIDTSAHRRAQSQMETLVSSLTLNNSPSQDRGTVLTYSSIFSPIDSLGVLTTTPLHNSTHYPTATGNNSLIDLLSTLLLQDYLGVDPNDLSDVKVTLTEEQFNNFPQISAKETHEGVCNICMDAYTSTDTLTVLPCKHLFHVHCIHDWLCKEKVTCPVCRKDTRDSITTQSN